MGNYLALVVASKEITGQAIPEVMGQTGSQTKRGLLQSYSLLNQFKARGKRWSTLPHIGLGASGKDATVRIPFHSAHMSLLPLSLPSLLHQPSPRMVRRQADVSARRSTDKRYLGPLHTLAPLKRSSGICASPQLQLPNSLPAAQVLSASVRQTRTTGLQCKGDSAVSPERACRDLVFPSISIHT